MFRSLKGETYDWQQFAELFSANMHRRWSGRLDADIIDEAIAATMLELLERWVNYPSSTNEDGTYKLERALLHARSRFGRHSFLESRGRTAGPNEARDVALNQSNYQSSVEEEEVFQWLEQQDPDVVQDWFRHLEGSASEQARVENVDESAVRRRRTKRQRAMKKSWYAYKA